ncbi:hypothetical protein BL254_18230 [Protofrankia sp. BMG5.30]|nr:hypothetical protein BL254_18230 [Protofrankia sp. BMG5.30]
MRGSFGPATLWLAGARTVLDLDDGGSPPLRLTWTDEPGQATEEAGRAAVGRQVAQLLRTSGTAVFARPDLLRLARRRKITDPPADAPSTPRSVQAITFCDGIRLEITSWSEPAVESRVPRNTTPAAGTHVPRNTAPATSTAPGETPAPEAGGETERDPRTAPAVPPAVPGDAPAAPAHTLTPAPAPTPSPSPSSASASTTGRSTVHDPDRDAHDAHTTGFGAWAGTRAVVLSTAQAHDLADLLEAWAALPPA